MLRSSKPDPPHDRRRQHRAAFDTSLLGDHNEAFRRVDYEARFDLTAAGRERLAELSALSHTRDIALICQCGAHDRCHCDLLLLWAEARLSAATSRVSFDYPIFRERLASL